MNAFATVLVTILAGFVLAMVVLFLWVILAGAVDEVLEKDVGRWDTSE